MKTSRQITLFGIIIIVLLSFAGCSNNEQTVELQKGKYIKKDAETLYMSSITIEEDNKFTFDRAAVLSYLPVGTYSVDGDKLILYVNEDESYIFKIEKDRLVFESSSLDISKIIEKGAVYELSGTTEQSSSEPTIGRPISNKSTNLMSDIKKNDIAPIIISDPNEQGSNKIKNRQVTDFGLEIITENFENENILISPISIMSALGMVTNGANGNTLREMEDVLKSDIEELNDYLMAYKEYLPSSKKYQVSLANSIWFKDSESLTVNQEFLQVNKDYYDASIYKAPFNETTKADINNWVKVNTNNMIDSVLNEAPPEDAIMYLINALSFDAEWANIYEINQIQDGKFTLEDGQVQTTEFMSSSENNYIENEKFTGIIKPYKGNQYAFVALLPKENIFISDLINKLDGQTIINLVEESEHVEVNTKIPKFSLENEILLNQSLQDLGMKDAFSDGNADFTGLGISTVGNIAISKVLHKTIIEVDERGTKAGAVTSVEIGTTSAVPGEPKEVILNRPFIYLIIDTQQNFPLFMGTLMSIN